MTWCGTIKPGQRANAVGVTVINRGSNNAHIGLDSIAPEMAEALEEMIEPYRAWSDVELRKRTYLATYKRIMRARALLRRAKEGE